MFKELLAYTMHSHVSNLITKYKYLDANFYLCFRLSCSLMYSLQLELEKIFDNLTSFC